MTILVTDMLIVIVRPQHNDWAGSEALRYSGKTGPHHRLDCERAAWFRGARGRTIVERATPLLVGAPRAGERQRGKVYVFRDVRARASHVIESDSTGAALGAMFTSLVGDVDGDKVPDVYASDFANSAKGPSTGRVYVRSGSTGNLLLTLMARMRAMLSASAQRTWVDVNQRHDDLLPARGSIPRVAPSGGRIYLYSGRDGSILQTITGRIAGNARFRCGGRGRCGRRRCVDFLVHRAGAT